MDNSIYLFSKEERYEKIRNKNISEYTLSKIGSKFSFCFSDGKLVKGSDLEKWEYIIIDIENTNSDTMTLDLKFRKSIDKPMFNVAFSLLPNSRIRLPIDFDILRSHQLFPERTVGRLGMMVSGEPVNKNEIIEILLASRKFVDERKLKVYKIYLSNQKDESILNPENLIDSFGQWIPKKWSRKINSKCQLDAVLKKLLNEAENFLYKYENETWSKYGGSMKKSFKSTGWFKVEKSEERWWLVDPEGYAFISQGLDCIQSGTETRIDKMMPYVENALEMLGDKLAESFYKTKSEGHSLESVNFGISNLIQVFGIDNWWLAWAKIVKMYLYKWNINTIGNWSSMEFISWSKMPYVLPLDVYSEDGFPSTENKIFRDFPDVFSEDYKIAAIKYAETLSKFKDDRLMIGYFLRNEPEWAFEREVNLAEQMMANNVMTESKRYFIHFLEKKYLSIDYFNASWNVKFSSFEELKNPIRHASYLSETARKDLSDFSRVLIRRYNEIPIKECKKIDPNHLNLGIRYAYISSSEILEGTELFDVFSFNCYQESPKNKLDEIQSFIDIPILIGEFHFGALDQGLTATGIRGVKSQRDRGLAYEYYNEEASKSNCFVGAHYFMLNDQSCIGRFDGENYQIGLIDICMQEYDEMTVFVQKSNMNSYEKIFGEKYYCGKLAESIPSIYC